MNEIFKLPSAHLTEMMEMEISPSRDLLGKLPKRKELAQCDLDELQRKPRLDVEDFLMRHFKKHRGQLAPMRRIIGMMNGKADAILKLTDVLPASLKSNKLIFEQLELLNGRNHVDDIQMHTRTASEILLKAGFVYPYVHEMMTDRPADFIELKDEIDAFGLSHHHHMNMQDRTVVRYITEFLIATTKRKLVNMNKRARAASGSLVPESLHRA